MNDWKVEMVLDKEKCYEEYLLEEKIREQEEHQRRYSSAFVDISEDAVDEE